MDDKKTSPETREDAPDIVRQMFRDRGYVFLDELIKSQSLDFKQEKSVRNWLLERKNEGRPIAGKLTRQIFVSVDALIEYGLQNYGGGDHDA